MKFYDGGTLVAVIVVSALAIGWLSGLWLSEDNDIEELAESIIEMQTGIDFDLTPNSSEK